MPPELHRTVVITTIHPPGAAVKGFQALSDWRLIVVGDKKTPAVWEGAGYAFLSAHEQASLDFAIGRTLPWNHYCRKMTGYLAAASRGAAVIADSDDDNIPFPGWGVPPFEGVYDTTAEDRGFMNVYRLFSSDDAPPWPRGFPLSRILPEKERGGDERLGSEPVRVGVWQGLVAGEADVDAIYRLTVNRPVHFVKRPPVVLAAGTLCPFNSQNTAFRKEVFPLLYLPAFVNFRFTDILRSLVAQPILWAAGFRLGFTSPTVRQERNPHDLMADFASEIPCYLHAEAAAETAAGAARSGRSVSENLVCVYEALAEKGIVSGREVNLVADWVADLEKAAAP